MIKRFIHILVITSYSFLGYSQGKDNDSTSSLSRPNIVVLLADDLGYGDLGCYGNTQISTPNLDRMATQGMLLTSCYASAPMCSPSRAGLLTGKIPNRTGVYDWIAPDSIHHLKTAELTIAEILKEAGYQTAHHGKWHLNGKMDGSQPLPSDHGFEYYFTTQYSAHHLSPNGFYRNGKKLYQQHGYSCDIVIKDAVRWLKNRDDDKPFFQYIAFHESHEPVAAPPDMLEKYCSAGKKASYYGCVSNLDRAVGNYLKQLEQMGLAENTIIIFTSDNGPASWNKGYFARSYGSVGELRGRKRYLWDGGIRVPGIISWPGHIKPGECSDVPVCNVDFLPTFRALAGLDIRDSDGTDVSPIFFGRPFTRKTPLQWHFYAPMEGPNSVMRKDNWVITAKWDGGEYSRGRFRAAHVKDMKSARLTDFELFDITADVHQDKDVSGEYPVLFKKLKKQLIQFHKQVQMDSPEW